MFYFFGLTHLDVMKLLGLINSFSFPDPMQSNILLYWGGRAKFYAVRYWGEGWDVWPSFLCRLLIPCLGKGWEC